MYGSVESHWVGWECEHGSMHVNSDSVIVEILDDCGAPVPEGASGNVVLTPLWRRTMPFIRYSTGDRCSMRGRCRCGRNGLKVLGPMEGRCSNMVLLSDGSEYTAFMGETVVRSVPEVLQYQMVQEDAGCIEVRVVLSAPLPAAALEKLRAGIAGAYGGRLDVSLAVVGRIPPGKNGKLCSFVSMLKARKPANRG
jgi:phenylacetate-CoA ligase